MRSRKQMLTRKSAKTLILGSGQAKKKILRMLAKEKLPTRDTKVSNTEKSRIKTQLDKLDSKKEKLIQKLRKVIGKTKKGGEKSAKGAGKDKAAAGKEKAAGKGKKASKLKGGRKQGGKGGKKPATTEDLDKELENYWIKKGEKGTVQSHLDSEMDDYWKKAGTGKPNSVDKESSLGANENTRVTSSVDGSMLVSLQEIQAKDMTGASPHYQGLNLISN